ncbi:patatin-like phospholipase family protein [Cupriavidus pauculus]|uniref:patatin-like phospholipase family protein n=1 Tax=Cupriavidus pauculus TaxID=82633 RepID=UPI001247BF0A|nr:patatin-like phospholipase family protein [Cupriavidus pauculus]KAB0599903.1 patatin-like phospholipase family protein [Cupriavidus pauculus]MCM3604026.1 patatin-like phospholipase family protein [Cupriavidus pauculus]UAL01230.1 patatin-like phospholipase family protein [Cupriavidus pauculus]
MSASSSSPSFTSSSSQAFDQVVFAGGGNRCWWQAGWWDTVAPALQLRPRVIAGISAGAATACMVYAHDSHQTMAYYRNVLADNSRNAYWGNLLRGERVFPHYGIYRNALLSLFGDNRLQKLQQAPEIRIGIAHIPRWSGPRLAVAAGLLAYNIDKHLLKTLHPRLGRKLGFQPEFVLAQHCRSPEDLADLLLQSASTPPFTPVLRRDGRAVLDGGLVDNVPVDALDPTPGNVLVLVTRLYPRPRRFVIETAGQRRLYLQPSQRVPISSWDYTRPEAMTHAYDLGRRDADAFLREWPDIQQDLLPAS